MFADDICLLAPTLSALQHLIDTSVSFCNAKGLNFNAKKSKVVVFSPKKVNLQDIKQIKINGSIVEYVSTVKYLGVTIESNKGFAFSEKNELRSFYRASNYILSAIQKPSKEILVHLLYTNCVPIITYACEIKSLSSPDINACNTAINNALRKIFSFNRWESVRSIRENFGKQSIDDIFAQTRMKFLSALSSHSNSILRCFSVIIS